MSLDCPTLVLLDVSRTQAFVFASNRLRDAVGASTLVADLADGLLTKAFEKDHLISNLKNGRYDDRHLATCEELGVEVIDRRGGTASLLFRDAGTARRFLYALGGVLFIHAPGLDVAHVVHTFHWDASGDEGKPSLAVALSHAGQALASGKAARARPIPAPVSASVRRDPGTDTAAADFIPDALLPGTDPNGRAASYAIFAKLDAAFGGDLSRAHQRLISCVPPEVGFTYPLEFEDLVAPRAEKRFLAVVHADGDELGQVGRKLLDNTPTTGDVDKDNIELIKRLRRFEAAISHCAQQALKAVVHALDTEQDSWMTRDEEGVPTISAKVSGGQQTRIRLSREKKKKDIQDQDRRWVLPVRPIVFGGDDVTFVADGRLGLALAVRYLNAFADEVASHTDLWNELVPQETITSSAGVAIVRLRHPFARAYHLAETLTKEAKTYRRDALHDELIDQPAAALNWLDATQLPDDLQAAREMLSYESTVENRTLHAYYAPVLLNTDGEARRWATVREALKSLQQPAQQSQEWIVAKRKVLQDALAQSPEAVRHLLTTIHPEADEEVSLPALTLSATSASQPYQEEGFVDDFSPYADALRLADWAFFPDTESEKSP